MKKTVLTLLLVLMTISMSAQKGACIDSRAADILIWETSSFSKAPAPSLGQTQGVDSSYTRMLMIVISSF